MTRDEQIAEKKRILQELQKEQMKCISEATKIMNLPKPKRESTYTKRMFRVLVWSIKTRSIEVQKQIIKATPIAASEHKGGGLAILGEGGSEELIIKTMELKRKHPKNT